MKCFAPSVAQLGTWGFVLVLSVPRSAVALVAGGVSPAEPAAVVAPPVEPGPRFTQADAGDARALFDSAKRGVVRIVCGADTGSGFFFWGSATVATAYHVIASGRPVSVVTETGITRAARVVAWDSEHDLAILQLAQSIDGTVVLPARRSAVAPGDAVISIGDPFGFSLQATHRSMTPRLTVTHGIVSLVSEAYVQTDAPVNPGNSGGPLLDLDGNVVGVISQRSNGEGIALAVPVARLLVLAGQTGSQGEHWGRLAGHSGLGYVRADHGLDGGALLLGVVAWDRLGVGLRLGLLNSVEQPPSGPLMRERLRWFAEGTLDYRFAWLSPNSFAAYLPIGFGFAYTRETIIDNTFTAQLTDATCDSGTEPCESTLVRSRDRRLVSGLHPLIHVGLTLPPIEFDLAAYLPTDRGGPTYRGVIGVVF